MVATHHCNGTSISLDLGPLDIDYVNLIKCEYRAFQILTVPILILWIIVLIDLLAKVASDYFSVTLADISSRWKLNDNFAGVTLVALANGGPDIFCAIIGLTSTGNASLSMSALLGGSLFVSSVVLGSVAILCPCNVNGLYFMRDATFLFMTVGTVAYLGSRKSVDIFSAISLCLLYLIYLVAVVVTPCIEHRHSNQQRDQPDDTLSRGKLRQSAMWTQYLSDEAVGEYSPPIHARISSSKPQSPGEQPGGYKFLIFDEYVDYQPTRPVPDDKELFGQYPKRESMTGRSNEATMNLPGESQNQSFASEIIWDFHPDENRQSTAKKPLMSEKSKFPLDGVANRSAEMNQLQESLLVGTSDDIVPHESRSGRFSLVSTARHEFSNFRLIRRLVKKWSESTTFQKIQLIAEYPFVTAMELSITTTHEEMWNKRNAVIQPLVVPIFMPVVFGQSHYLFTIQFAIGYVVCVIISALLLFFSTNSHPPCHPIFLHTWSFLGCILCVTWIFLLSGELVFCLTSVGRILNIPSFYLGLTILAWGNSVGDFFANLAIAKKGLGPMAVAGCYGGPTSNILIGLGVSLSYICYRNYPQRSSFELDHSAYISIVYTLVALTLSIIFTVRHQFRVDATLGYMLVSIYILYTVTETAVALLML